MYIKKTNIFCLLIFNSEQIYITFCDEKNNYYQNLGHIKLPKILYNKNLY